MQPEFLSYLIEQARDSSAAVVVPRTAKGLQPLAAVYRREFAAVAERSLRAGQNKIALSFAEIQTRIIEPEELEQERFFRRIISQSEHRARVAGSAAEAVSPMIKSIYY